jgi:hypothetical protein
LFLRARQQALSEKFQAILGHRSRQIECSRPLNFVIMAETRPLICGAPLVSREIDPFSPSVSAVALRSMYPSDGFSLPRFFLATHESNLLSARNDSLASKYFLLVVLVRVSRRRT